MPVPGIRRMVNLAATMDDVIHLSIGQPDFKPPDHVVQAAVEALQAGQTGYTMDAGLPELLDALADYYRNRYQRPLVPENIMVTTGATEAMVKKKNKKKRTMTNKTKKVKKLKKTK
eukprot:gnl/TRDRNA2_/TRDRNA2_158093_c1_seq1.p2 gnl/TRDRNA2_/TRDRNA2_158093_c1~~gnl/TRDRNA2_/TRDRNA2_158093_c1_seq1.p2  ORF type:complete len:116 (-),score=20.03 gnl/TRDRNA2_/TRDRNA2_158093_c1_seq1:24-371(-)